ncbi:hypothetical protein [Acidisoma sp. C75]
MRLSTKFGKLLPAAVLAGGMMAGGAAFAQTASQQSLDQGATTGLGAHHRFTSVAAAQAHCPGDTIVWSNGVNLTYHVVQSPTQAKGRGFFACKMEADTAGFHEVP